jgi:hypothetical protein
MKTRRRGGARPPPAPAPVRDEPMFWNGRRVGLGAIALIVAVIACVLWLQKKPAQKHGPRAGDADDDQTQALAQIPGQSKTPPSDPQAAPPPAPSPSADPPPVIDEVIVEKPEVCAGEENLITVRAHTTNGTNEFLHYVIDGKQGQSVPMTLWRGDHDVQGTHTITVFGRGNSSTTTPLPTYTVDDCRPTYIAAIENRVRANSWADFDFAAKLVGIQRGATDADRKRGAQAIEPPAHPYKVSSYVWNFGDGQTATTFAPYIDHSYEGRTQDSLYSYFIVSVEINGTKGEKTTGRMSLSLINPAFESLKEKGIVEILVSLDPRFPELGSDGRVTQHVKLWHTRPGPVTVERMTMTKYYIEATGESAPVEVDPSSVLGSVVIPAGKDGITTTIYLDVAAEPETFAKTYAILGTSSEGFPASGSFSVMKPPAKPSADSGTAIVDPLMKQKIMLARQMLGKDVVDDEDLWALERQGAFADLKVSPAESAAAAAAAANRPPPGPPPAQQTSTYKGPEVPKSTAEQAATPTGPSGGNAGSGK